MKLLSMDHESTECTDKFYMTFGRDGDIVSKTVMCTHFGKKAKASKSEIAMSLQRAAREADRDLAFRKHGKDFRSHCEMNSGFFGPLSEEELDKFLT